MDEDTEIREVTPNDKEFRPKQKFWISFCMGFLCCTIIASAAFILFARGYAGGKLISEDDYEYYKELESTYSKYHQIVKMIRDDPLSEYTPEGISDDDIRELIRRTGDPYAEYYTAEEYAEFEKRYTSDYVGVGIGILEENGNIVVKTVFDNGPADEAGMLPEDIIVEVDGTAPATVDDAVSMLTGEAGTSVTVIVDRAGQRVEMTMIREKLREQSVSYFALEEDESIGYIAITLFRQGTADDFELAVRDLSNKGCDKFIIDLRDNGGGLTDESISIADYLLPECRIMTDVMNDGSEDIYNSEASSADIDYVVLVNGNTASASEILAGALQDNGGTIIGTKTFGKGVTQLTHKFSDGSAVKLTISEYFRPSGAKVQGEGITPDIEAEGEEALRRAIEELNR